MYVQTKKALIVGIFLISIISLLILKNSNTQTDELKLTVVSSNNNVDYSLTKILWNEIQEMQYDYRLTSEYRSINSKYLQITDEKNFAQIIDKNIEDTDVIVILGQEYNQDLQELFLKYDSKKFVLIENNYTPLPRNVYQININWTDLFENILDKVDQIIEDNLESKKIKQEDLPIKIGYILKNTQEDNQIYKIFIDEIVNHNNLQLYPIMIEDEVSFMEELETAYNQNDVSLFISPDFSLQNKIISNLVEIQKSNIYDVEYSKENTNENQNSRYNNSETKEYKPIKYITFYNENYNLGEYDNILVNPVQEENIVLNDFDLNYIDNLITICLDNDQKEKQVYELTIKNGGVDMTFLEKE